MCVFTHSRNRYLCYTDRALFDSFVKFSAAVMMMKDD